MRDGWEREAGNWARFARTPGHDRSHENINLPAFRELLPPPGGHTLDFGCGEGRIGLALASLGHQVTGIDASPSMARLAHGQAGRQPVLVADGTALPFRDQAFDLVAAYMVLHDTDDLIGAVTEIGRVLQPGGRLCAAVVHPINSAGDFANRDPDAPFVIAGSYLEVSPRSLVADRDGVRLTFHSEHRPLETYSRALQAAGLLIETLREPTADDRAVAAGLASQKWTRIPLFLHIRAIKP